MLRLVVVFCVVSGISLYASDTVLIGGTPTQPGEFEEVVRIRSGSAGCSASVIGPRVVLTAAHCVQGDIQDARTSSVEFESLSKTFKAKCFIPPDYRSEVGDQDMALCKSEAVIYGPYASVSLTGPVMDEEVTLIGYGCTQPGGSGGNDGILRYGRAKVTKESTDVYYSFHALGSSALCFGDSGGPAFKLTDDPKGHHYVYGVNSRGNIRDLSLLTAMYHPKSVKFMKDFEDREGVKICGVSMDCDKDKQEECPNRRAQVEVREKRVEIKEKSLAIARVLLERSRQKLKQCLERQ